MTDFFLAGSRWPRKFGSWGVRLIPHLKMIIHTLKAFLAPPPPHLPSPCIVPPIFTSYLAFSVGGNHIKYIKYIKIMHSNIPNKNISVGGSMYPVTGPGRHSWTGQVSGKNLAHYCLSKYFPFTLEISIC